ncbi:MAG: hypothetical protein II815_01210 [Bacteroidales bacterium]|nr:hypothetical protein [Bacteroidales bacterium]
MADAVSMAAPFECLRRFYGYAVFRFAVSSLTSLRAAPFFASLFQWLRTFLAALFLGLGLFADNKKGAEK